jgi:hypothetical protein
VHHGQGYCAGRVVTGTTEEAVGVLKKAAHLSAVLVHDALHLCAQELPVHGPWRAAGHHRGAAHAACGQHVFCVDVRVVRIRGGVRVAIGKQRMLEDGVDRRPVRGVKGEEALDKVTVLCGQGAT